MVPSTAAAGARRATGPEASDPCACARKGLRRNLL